MNEEHTYKGSKTKNYFSAYLLASVQGRRKRYLEIQKKIQLAENNSDEQEYTEADLSMEEHLERKKREELLLNETQGIYPEIYASLAQAEMEKKEKRQREGMEAKKLRGEWDEVGRPRAIEPEKFNHEFLRVIEKEVTPTQLQRELGLTASTFYRYRKDFFEKFPQFVQFQK